VQAVLYHCRLLQQTLYWEIEKPHVSDQFNQKHSTTAMIEVLKDSESDDTIIENKSSVSVVKI